VVKVAAVASLLLLASPALAAKKPAWSAQGAISRIKSNLITVHGTTCKLAGPVGRQARQTYQVGVRAKIRCANGVLTKIAVLPLPPIVATGTNPSSASRTVTVSGTITNVDGMTITIGAVTCDIDETTSPNTDALQDGTFLSSMRCTGTPLRLAAFTVG
jgi:hypothetical protein